MKRNILFFVPRQAIRRLWACMLPMVAAALLMGCSKVDDPHALPAGKHPITFAAAVEGLTAQKAGTRATGKDVWTADDQVSISTHADGSSPKTYKITNASTGAMEPDNTGDVLYWQLSKNQPIRAWYPATDVTNADISNQSAGYADYDYLTSDGTYDFASSVSLSFKHQMAKVKYTLQKGEGISDTEFSSATVQIYGFTKANFAGGMLTGNTPGWITPHATDKEAILVPQQMQNQQFIKVTIGTSDAARDYYYTPAGATDADLAAGKQYTYDITVKKNGLEVMVKDNGVAWTDSELDSGTSEAAKYHIRGGDDMTLAAGVGGTLTDQSGYKELSGTNLLKVTVAKQADKFLKGISVIGVYTIQSWKSDASNYEIIYQLKGDVALTNQGYEEKPTLAVGSYFYGDGEWSTELRNKQCIGIVFKVGKDGSDNGSYPNGMTVQGYVVALEDANNGGLAWANKDGNYSANVGISTSDSDWKGYSNTQAIKNYTSNGWSIEHFPAANACLNFGTTFPKYAAPNSSSGWFLPSCGQLKFLYTNGSTLSGKIDNLKRISGYEDIKWLSGSYWSGSEDGANPADLAWRVAFDGGNVARGYKSYGYRVRSLFAF